MTYIILQVPLFCTQDLIFMKGALAKLGQTNRKNSVRVIESIKSMV
jgi:hypothetical protein